MPEATLAALRSLVTSRWAWPVLALVLTLAGLLELLRPGVVDPARVGLVVVLLCAPVAVANRLPLAAACAQALVIVAGPGTEGAFPETPIFAQAAIAYACGAYASGWAGGLGAAVLLVSSEVVIGFPDEVFVPLFLATAAPWQVGRLVSQRRRLVEALDERSRELEAEEDAFARLSVRRERARIARELHDIATHHLAVIVIQAGAGRVADPSRVGQAAERFSVIRQSGEDALAEMGRLVDILHADDRDGHTPGRLRLLLEELETGGMDVRVTPLPAGVELPAEVEVAAHRVIQEGLTNAMKHAPGAPVDVRVGLDGDAVEIVVRNGAGRAASRLVETGSGLGLTGMRERVESVGGCLDAGPDGGGWRLHARLPLPALVPTG